MVLNGVESDTVAVISSVVQGTVLGPFLFVLYIDDIDLFVSILCYLYKFADDTKLIKSIENAGDKDALQTALNNVCEWAWSWQMTFNIAKCKVLHFGHNNPLYEYTMNGVVLDAVDTEWEAEPAMCSSGKQGQCCFGPTKKSF